MLLAIGGAVGPQKRVPKGYRRLSRLARRRRKARPDGPPRRRRDLVGQGRRETPQRQVRRHLRPLRRRRSALSPKGVLPLMATSTCRSCNAPITWGESASGKRTPFDLDGSSHFTTCPDSCQWSGKSAAGAQPAYEDITCSAGIRRQVAIKTRRSWWARSLRHTKSQGRPRLPARRSCACLAREGRRHRLTRTPVRRSDGRGGWAPRPPLHRHGRAEDSALKFYACGRGR